MRILIRSRMAPGGLGAWLAACAVSACSTLVGPSARDDEGAVEHATSAIVGGVADGDAAARDAASDAALEPVSDAVVALALDDGHICTGTLIAPDIVLTARHCLSNTRGLSVRCTTAGQDTGGGGFTDDRPPGSLRVFLGRVLDTRRSPAALGKKALYAASEVACDADLALLLLDRKIAGVQPFAVRRSGATRAGETLRAVGFGRTETGTIGERRRRDDVRVLANGPVVSSSQTALGSRELEVTQSFCDGDSGGPALSRSGAVVGVASRGPACTARDGYVYTTVRGFAAVLAEAESLTGSTIAREPGDLDTPDPAPGDGGAADADAGASDGGPEEYDRGLPARCAFVAPTSPALDSRRERSTLLVLFALVAVAWARRRARHRTSAAELCSSSARIDGPAARNLSDLRAVAHEPRVCACGTRSA